MDEENATRLSLSFPSQTPVPFRSPSKAYMHTVHPFKHMALMEITARDDRERKPQKDSARWNLAGERENA
jgi:hypothetical protein